MRFKVKKPHRLVRRVVGGADRTCFWLTEAVKVGAAERFKQSGHEDYFVKASNLLPAILTPAQLPNVRLTLPT